MFKMLAALITLLSFNLEASSNSEIYGDELTSRYITNSDPKVTSLAGMALRSSWWSRPHEYAWAAQFAGSDYVVLDAASGVSHPFKWYLGETCKETFACDADPRIANITQIVQETSDDLGKEAYGILITTPRLYNQVHLVQASICQLPDTMPKFDRIFCISTLEHLSTKDRQSCISEFSRALAPGGLLVLTVDYPEVTPEVLIALADSVDLVPAGNVIGGKPPKDALTNGHLSIYRAIFTPRK